MIESTIYSCVDSLQRRGYYCCQLVRHIYAGILPLPTRILQFGDDTNTISSDYWTAYFARWNSRVPVAGVGSHPQDLFLCTHIKRVIEQIYDHQRELIVENMITGENED
jgi:hypothetical protein